MWKRKRLNFCGSGSTLKKEGGSELGSIWLFEESEAEAFFIKHGAGMWKRLNFCGSESTLKKLEAKANSEATNFIRSWKRKQKIFYCFHISDAKHHRSKLIARKHHQIGKTIQAFKQRTLVNWTYHLNLKLQVIIQIFACTYFLTQQNLRILRYKMLLNVVTS